MYSNDKVFLHAVSKKADISLDSINLTKKQNKNVQHELPQYHIKFHPDEMKSVRENEAKRFCFTQTFWPQAKVKVTVSGMKW